MTDVGRPGKILHNRINRNELRERILVASEDRTTLSFYVYSNIPDPDQFRNLFYTALNSIGVLGRIYVACEGVNAGALHILLANMVGIRKEGFIADVTRDREVWNHQLRLVKYYLIQPV